VLTADDAATFERCMAVGGIAVFPADTVYGLACDPGNRDAVQRLMALKRRALGKPSAVMLFSLELALEALPELSGRTHAAMEALMPGAVTLVVPNPAGRFPLAGGDEAGTLGVRVPALPPAGAALHAVRWPVLQTSANLAGGTEARALADVPERLRGAADLVLDGGPLPGTASTVIDLRAFDAGGSWSILREGLLSAESVEAALGAL
jgi:L-threonylcarbamoyladenylate synthase